MKRSMEDGEKRFNQLSIEERGKFDEETLVNVNNIRKQSTTSQRSSGFSNEYIVVSSCTGVLIKIFHYPTDLLCVSLFLAVFTSLYYLIYNFTFLIS